MAAPVKEFMSGHPVSIEAEASALEALDLMVDRGIRHLPVVDARRRVIGVLSVEDLRAALPVSVGVRTPLSPEQRALARDWKVGEIMTHHPETVGPDASLARAAETMAEGRIGCLPVIDESGCLEGLLSETDVLHALATLLWTEEVRERKRVRSGELDSLIAELRAERQRIAARLDAYHAEERRLSVEPREVPMDASDAAQDLRSLGETEGLDALAARRLHAIDHALDRAAQGRLSVCERCGGVIPVTRLRALPGTTLCVSCARAAEVG
jgi:CBS domain-containing protein/RNA polymerase-binding transcription factor DksA